MEEKRILTVQDLSCVGQCSLTVALPILSALGIETAVFPTAVLSTHTGGFTGWTCHDLSGDMDAVFSHWKNQKIKFSTVYTGYLGEISHMEKILAALPEILEEDGLFVVDPAFADNGKCYPAFGPEYVSEMAKFSGHADLLIPNITEACFLTGTEYKEVFEEKEILLLLEKLKALGAKRIILKGLKYREGQLGIAVYDGQKTETYFHDFYPHSSHGTGDVYSSAVIGTFLNGKSLYESAVIAADFTYACLKDTKENSDHWYGVYFERNLPKLWEKVKR